MADGGKVALGGKETGSYQVKMAQSSYRMNVFPLFGADCMYLFLKRLLTIINQSYGK
jgi:hypothetical protein